MYFILLLVYASISIISCPPGTTVSPLGNCVSCPLHYYCPPFTDPIPCPPDYFCATGSAYPIKCQLRISYCI